MILFTRSTRNERDVLAAALTEYNERLIERLDAAKRNRTDADAEWRHFQTDAILAQLRTQ